MITLKPIGRDQPPMTLWQVLDHIIKGSADWTAHKVSTRQNALTVLSEGCRCERALRALHQRLWHHNLRWLSTLRNSFFGRMVNVFWFHAQRVCQFVDIAQRWLMSARFPARDRHRIHANTFTEHLLVKLSSET